MDLRTAAAMAFAAIAFTGCAVAPQANVNLDNAVVASKTGRIGVAMTPIPKVDTELPGAACLLCIAAASIANASLIDYSHSLPLEDLPQLKEELVRHIRAKGGNAVAIAALIEIDKLAAVESNAPNTARKNFAPLRERLGVDHLVVLQIEQVGMTRTYSAYIPTSDPKATLRGKGYMINLANNTYEWYQPVTITKASDKEWDEPPKFPGLTNAYFQVLELGKDEFLKPFR